MTHTGLDKDKLSLHSTVAMDAGKIPFYTLLGYVEERFSELSKSSAPTCSFLLDNISIEKKVPSAASDAAEDFAGDSSTWLRFSMRPSTSPIEMEGDQRAAEVCLTDQRQWENEYHMKRRAAELSNARAQQPTHYGWNVA